MDVATPGRITAETQLNDVLARYPATAPVFTQGRRLYVDQLHDLYARFPGLTVGDFAGRNDLDLGAVLLQVNAIAESEDAARQPATRAKASDEVRQTVLADLGTPPYRPRRTRFPMFSVVAVQSSAAPSSA
jgi:hypothetical protein